MMKIVSYESTLPKTHLTWKEGKVMVFRKPAQERRLGMLLCVAHVFMYIVLPLSGAVLTGKPAWYWFGVLGAGLVLFSFYNIAGPDDIRLDGSECVYERTFGWPWKPTKRRGTFENIKGISISPANAVWLLLYKRDTILGGTMLYSSGTRIGAEALAEDVSREFGFPIVPYPK